MDHNVGQFDAGLRWICAAFLLGASIAFADYLIVSLAMAVFVVLLVGTAITGKCPLYTLLHVNTRLMRVAK